MIYLLACYPLWYWAKCIKLEKIPKENIENLLKADDDVTILKDGANNINIIDNDNSAVDSDADNDYFWD